MMNRNFFDEATWFYIIHRSKTLYKKHMDYSEFHNERLNIGITVNFKRRLNGYPFHELYKPLLLILFKNRMEALEFEDEMKEICFNNPLLKGRNGSKEKYDVIRNQRKNIWNEGNNKDEEY